jgi:hypothetical protein
VVHQKSEIFECAQKCRAFLTFEHRQHSTSRAQKQQQQIMHACRRGFLLCQSGQTFK